MNNSMLDVLKKAREQLQQQLRNEPELVVTGTRFDEVQESGIEAKANLHRSMRP
ncbi:hypothetical protein AADX40_15115 [Aeromonas veronii]|uniref:hypothetical protein n=1 Tax=Aeromonas TaxID=642 RepID=UPI003158114F